MFEFWFLIFEVGISPLIIPSGRGSGRNSFRGSCVGVGSWVGVGSEVYVDAGSTAFVEDVGVPINGGAFVSTCGWQAGVKINTVRRTIGNMWLSLIHISEPTRPY